MPGAVSDRVLPGRILRCMERIRDYTGGRRATFYDSRMARDAVRYVYILRESNWLFG